MFVYQMTSDEFFGQYGLKEHFPKGIDIAFLDGMHLCEYLLRDFANTQRFCHGKSLVFMHDCLPLNARMAERSYRTGELTEGPLWAAWTGDVWRVLFALKKFLPDLSVMLLDCQPTGLVAVSNINATLDVPDSAVRRDRRVHDVTGIKRRDAGRSLAPLPDAYELRVGA